ncbi:hypothetical protein K501DRAFT_240606 [Backusella circina FSU 941]|nr:hypothetical protein K501DRAFT_240606 [Backusella circina FSU 941]
MAPIILKVKGNNQLLPFSNLDSEDDLSKTWRVCTKVKDALENGSRLENLSWRLWFSHNVQENNKKNKKSQSLRNFTVPDNFDFNKAQKKKNNNNCPNKTIISTIFDKEAEYRRKLSLQQQKQAQQKLQGNAQRLMLNAIKQQQQRQQQELQIQQQQQQEEEEEEQQRQQEQQQQQQQQQQQHQFYQHEQHHYHHQQQQQSLQHQTLQPQQHHNQQITIQTDPSNKATREEFILNQYTSDQAGDQVVELEDIFSSFSDMQAYLDSSAGGLVNPASVTEQQQQIDTLMSEVSWNTQEQTNYNPYFSQQEQALMHTNVTTTPVQPTTYTDAQQQAIYNNQYPNYTYNNSMASNTDMDSTAVYVSSEIIPPPVPIGTLHNKLLATLPKETLESAERLILTAPTNNDDNTMNTSISTTPNISNSNNGHCRNLDQQQQQDVNSFSFTIPNSRPQQQPVVINPTFHHYQSKSMPPSRASSPPPPSIDTSISSSSSSANSSNNSSASSSPTIVTKKSSSSTTTTNNGKQPVCTNCHTTSTPLWRRSANDELLCNACGLYLKLHNAPRPKYLKPQSVRKDARIDSEEEQVNQPLCSNCGTSTTPLWRRDIDGTPLCNACGLYLKLHHEKRPLSMKTDNIKKRQRCDHTKPAPNKQKKNRLVKQDGYYGTFGLMMEPSTS